MAICRLYRRSISINRGLGEKPESYDSSPENLRTWNEPSRAGKAGKRDRPATGRRLQQIPEASYQDSYVWTPGNKGAYH